MKLVIAMPGKEELQRRFWDEAIIGQGLDADVSLQANSPIGRDRGNYMNFPEDWVGRNLDEVAVAMHARVRHLIDTRWTPKTYSNIYVDYEPRRYGPDRETIIERWTLNVLRNGFESHDVAFLNKLIDGAHEASDGLPVSLYSLPRLTKGPIEPRDYRNMSSARGFTDKLDWLWLNGYATGNDDRDFLDRENISEHYQRIRTGTMALRKTGKDVVPFVWPSYKMTPAESKQYNTPTIYMLAAQGHQKLGIWVDLNHEGPTNTQIENMIAIAPHLRAWMETE